MITQYFSCNLTSTFKHEDVRDVTFHFYLSKSTLRNTAWFICRLATSSDILSYTNSTPKLFSGQQLSAVIVDVSPKSRYIPVGGTARFSCTSKTSSRYSITWSRENNNPLPSSSHVKDGTLIISNARLGDGGTYICTGKNLLNIDRAIISLHVGG